jgi:hypothetical protein
VTGLQSHRGATLSSSLRPALSGWTKPFTDPRLCAAIVEHLTFAGQIIEAGTVSYRLAQARAVKAA